MKHLPRHAQNTRQGKIEDIFNVAVVRFAQIINLRLCKNDASILKY